MKKKRVIVLNYAKSLLNNKEAWKTVSLKNDISLKKKKKKPLQLLKNKISLFKKKKK